MLCGFVPVTVSFRPYFLTSYVLPFAYLYTFNGLGFWAGCLKFPPPSTFLKIYESTQAGHDFKSIMINLASCILFVLPLAMFFFPQYIMEELGAVVMTMILALLVPPRGWKRPHPYSDMIHNRP
jgi:hypothetical protein